jgi:hypothetical protein
MRVECPYPVLVGTIVITVTGMPEDIPESSLILSFYPIRAIPQVKIRCPGVDRACSPFEKTDRMTEKQAQYMNENQSGSSGDGSVTGLNNNLEFMGKQLHVQTERIGFPTPRIVTQVFSNGRVVLSKKSDIAPGKTAPQELAEIEELMRTQHFQTIREIEEKQKRILGSTPAPK